MLVPSVEDDLACFELGLELAEDLVDPAPVRDGEYGQLGHVFLVQQAANEFLDVVVEGFPPLRLRISDLLDLLHQSIDVSLAFIPDRSLKSELEKAKAIIKLILPAPKF